MRERAGVLAGGVSSESHVPAQAHESQRARARLGAHQLDEAYRSTVEAIHKNQEKYGNETCFFMGGTSRIWAMGLMAR